MADARYTRVRVSTLISDPFVRRAFERAERDAGAAPMFATTPSAPVLSGGALAEVGGEHNG